MSRNRDTGDDELGKRIRTLTSLLHRLKVQKLPKQPRNIPPFLSHFTTLLTCGDEDDQQAKKVIATTGSIDSANQVRILIVSQNPYPGPPVQHISLKLVQKDEKLMEEVVKGRPNAPLVDHVADVWAALSALTRIPRGPGYTGQLKALELFFLSRSYRKFVTRFRADVRLCNGRRLFEVIAEWQPDRSEISAKWVRPYNWLVESKSLPSIKSRVVQGEVEWEFSDDTKKAWSKILEILLIKLDEAIEYILTARTAAGREAHEEVCQGMVTLNTWCRLLCYFVVWDAGIVKSLLTETNMVASLTTKFVSARGDSTMDEADDDATAEFLQEPNESKGEQVYRYLKTVIAWHHAVSHFSRDATLPKLLENVTIGLVEVPPSSSSVLSIPQISEVFFERFSGMTDVRDQVLKVLEDHHRNTFSGCIHAEATLIGLVNYYALTAPSTNRSMAVMDAPHIQDLIQPMAGAVSVVVAVSKKCCWCCDWLGQHLETRFKLPGTHGIVYPWDPPTVGISDSVLRQLEEALWNELYQAVFNLVSPPYSRHSSAASSVQGVDKGWMDEWTDSDDRV